MDIMVRVDGAMHLATIQKLSRFGARLVDVPALAQGALVELALPDAGFAVVEAIVVHVLDAETAARHGVRSGVIVKFRAPLDVGRRTVEMSTDQLEELVVATRPLAFAGALADLPCATVLLMLEQARKSGQLVLARGELTATIDLVDGRVTGARWSSGPADPRAIVMDALGWTDGTFELFATEPREIAFQASVTELLLDRARMQDERSRFI